MPEMYVEIWSESCGKTKHMNFVAPSGDYIDVRVNISDHGKEYYMITIDNSISDQSPTSFSSLHMEKHDFLLLCEALSKFDTGEVNFGQTKATNNQKKC